MMKSVFLSMIVVVMCFGCAQLTVKKEPPQRIFPNAEVEYAEGVVFPIEELVALERRIKEYWDARMDNNWHMAFDYEDPDVIKREKITRGGYAGGKLGFIKEKEYEIKGFEVLAPDRVRSYSFHKMFVALPFVNKDETIRIVDIWMKKEGNWYRKLVLDPFTEGATEKDIIKIPAVPAKPDGEPKDMPPVKDGQKPSGQDADNTKPTTTDKK